MVIQIQMAPELVKMDQKGPNFEFRSFFILFSKNDNPLSYTIKMEIHGVEHSTFTFFSQTVNMQTEIMYAFELDSNEASFHYAHFPFNTTLSLTIRNIEYS